MAAAVIGLLSFLPGPVSASEADETLLLAVVVNRYPTGKIGEFIVHHGALCARRTELRALGFRVPEAAADGTRTLLALSDLPGVIARLDQPTQTLYVTAAAESLAPSLLTSGAVDREVRIESGIGTTLDYDVIGTAVDGRRLGSGSFDLRGFSPWGVASSGYLAYAGGSPAGSSAYSAVRLDSSYVYSDPATLRRYRLGDYVSGSLPWTRPVRLGGIQVMSDFSMRPDLVTFPVPAVGGSVAVPSTVDILVNGTQLLSRQVQPGPFQVPQLPVITGAGTVSMTITNALGRQVTTELPFYASPAMLAPGLQTYSAEAGVVRRDWGIVSDDYGSPAAAATYRRGLSPVLTVEGHGEASRGMYMAGAGGFLNLDNLAVANLAAAGSTVSGNAGAQLSAGLQHIDPRLSAGASATLASRNFGDIAAVNGDPAARLQVNANAGLSLGRFGSVGVTYIGLERAAAPPPVGVVAPLGLVLSQSPLPARTVLFQPPERSHIVAASYSVQLGRVFLYATLFDDLANHANRGAMLQLTIPLGPRSSASAGVQSASGVRSAQLQVAQSANTIGDWGYEILGAPDHPNHEFAELSYKSPWGLVSAGADRFAHRTTLQAEAQGALSFVDASLFPSNRVDDSFAVVDTNGIAGVRVRQENRDVGRTDAGGRLLVPDLRSFEVNHLSIEPLDAPIDATVPFAARDVRPQDRSGVIVRFPIERSHGALLRLRDEAGAPIPFGSVATLRSTGAAVPVGYDGQAYFVDLRPRNTVDVERPDGRRCTVIFGYRPIPGDIPAIGPLRCREAAR